MGTQVLLVVIPPTGPHKIDTRFLWGPATLHPLFLRQSVKLRLSMNVSAFSDRLNTRILDLITKQTIIGIPVIFCSGGFLMTEAITYALYKDSEVDYVIGYCCRATEGMSISLLLYLGLSLNDHLYRKLCGFCHRKCYQCAQSGFKKQMDKGYSMMDLDDFDSNNSTNSPISS